MSPLRLSEVRQEQIARILMLTLLMAAIGSISIRMAYVTDNDIWWHMRAGQWILEHHAFPHTGPFSIHGMGKPCQAYCWHLDLILL